MPFLKAAAMAALLTAGAGSGALAQPAGGGSPPGQCFDLSAHRGIVALDDHTLVMRVQANYYLIKMAEACPGLNHPDPRITAIANGGSFVCGRLDWTVRVGEMGVPGSSIPCNVASQRRLTKAEVATLPPDKRPD